MKLNQNITIRMLRPAPQISYIYNFPPRQGEAFGQKIFCGLHKLSPKCFAPTVIYQEFITANLRVL